MKTRAGIVAVVLSTAWMSAQAAELRSNAVADSVRSAQSPSTASDCIVANAQRNTLAVEKNPGPAPESFEVRVKNIVDGALIDAFLADVAPDKAGSTIRVHFAPGVLAPEKMQSVLLQGC